VGATLRPTWHPTAATLLELVVVRLRLAGVVAQDVVRLTLALMAATTTPTMGAPLVLLMAANLTLGARFK
jgi:hypothetical protein